VTRLLVVGGGLAGHRAALAARRVEPDIEIVILAAEHERPYQRPPLSKGFLLGTVSPERVTLRARDGAYELRPGVAALGLDRARGVVLTTAGEEPYDRLLIATGAQPRRLPGFPPEHRVVYLRTLGDAIQLRELLATSDHCTVIGGGFIGLEVAASARQRGLEVTIVEAADRLLARAVGLRASALIEANQRSLGVDVRLATTATWVDRDRRLLRVGDQELATDLVVVGIGVQPALDWLGDALGVDPTLGLRATATGMVTDDGTIGVAGDAGAWWHPRFGRHLRFEHFETAATQGVRAAESLLRPPGEDLVDLPFGWSDQGSLLVQVLGAPEATLDEEQHEVDDGWVLTYRRGTRIEGAVLMNAPGALLPTKQEMERTL
jgi:3-phenylpropionate/trans-cinnamate dioxygenase ferredoxin reductase subunit